MTSECLGFANVDIDLYITGKRPKKLLKELAVHFTIMSSDRKHIALELLDVQPRDPEQAVDVICGHIEALSPEAAHEWRACRRRVMDLGLRAVFDQHSLHYSLTREALARIAGVQADLEVSLYRSRAA
jgi:hypothetical protein